MIIWRYFSTVWRHCRCGDVRTRTPKRDEYDLEAGRQPHAVAQQAAQRGVEELEARERESLPDIAARTQDIQSLEAEISELKGEVQRRKIELEMEREGAARRALSLEGELTQTRETVANLREELAATVRQASEERDLLLAQVKSAEGALDRERLTLTDVRRAVSQQDELLVVRSRELKDALALVPREDVFSCSELITMIAGLNEEISQTSALVEDACIEGMEVTQDIRDAAADTVSRHLGATMTELLRACGAQMCDRLIVQLAIQAYLMQLARDLINSWIPTTGSPSVNCFMAQVYEEMTRSEPQPIFAKWRQLARAYGRATQPTSDFMLGEADPAVHTIESVLILAGVQLDPDELSYARLKEKIGEILVRCMRLRDAIGEGVVTCDFRVTGGAYGKRFNAESMEDVFKRQDSTIGEVLILCASELGLERSTKSTDAKESRDLLTLTTPSNAKAKVVTTEALDELLRAD
ncbi:hypothetical protein PHLGIDRAFT_123657 [Phlebiopsis gigantea 11061_1 CR5-6]|uniref:Uncharacterized protein n=1 Tax=Phlebiopsis gigantea (strain 11061_1 CR5-6) TaxID=745531 RepID=A0A0C3RP17_PHLG1|nr:hypothetical protein PHLGIDRAFT_123657 [Phlebiopsis gigantea 11061_1 CR5-6]